MKKEFSILIKEIRQCQVCAEQFTHEPNPIFQMSPSATVLIAGQAPGRKVHESGIPFNDPSGDRLRDWMGISEKIFYDASKVAILPMGFCYPGKVKSGQGKSGDLPPRPECALAWRSRALELMPNIQLILVIGRYAINWHLGESKKHNLTETVRAWKCYAPDVIPLPHPSPRNNIWLRKNAWFENEVLPILRKKIQTCLTTE